MKNTDFGFALRSKHIAGQFRPFATFICKCGATLEEIVPAGPVNPEAVAKRARNKGWDCDAWFQSATRCPACLSRKTSGDKPNKDIKMSEKPREITQAERLKIRAILDKHFDDAAGCWLDGYSDQRAGEEAGVPWAHVTKIREAAYGPIRVDPALMALKEEVSTLAREMALMVERRAALEAKLNAMIEGRKVA